METSKRDPRVDPHPGDTISRDNKNALYGIILRDVTRAHGGLLVFFNQDNGRVSYPRASRLLSNGANGRPRQTFAI